VHKPGLFQYTIHYEGKSFSCPRTQKGFTSYYMHFSSFKICSHTFLVSAILHHILLLRRLPKSYLKIDLSTFQPNFLCSSSFKLIVLPQQQTKITYITVIPHCALANRTVALNTYSAMMVRAGTTVMGPMKRSSSPTTPVSPTSTCRPPAIIRLPSSCTRTGNGMTCVSLGSFGTIATFL